MTDQELKKVLQEYAAYDAGRYRREDVTENAWEPSARFRRRIRRLFRTERFFGEHLRIAQGLGKVAAIVLVIGSLAAVGDVSARALGIRPWKYVSMEQLRDVGMESRVYSGNSTVTNEEAKEQNTIPTYVPEGFEQTYTDIDEWSAYSEWEKENSLIQYGRSTLKKNTVIIEDTDYLDVKNADIRGYYARICSKEHEVRIIWEDEYYYHNLSFTECELSEEEMLKMVDSIYDR